MNPLLEQFLVEARENLAFIDQNISEIGDDDPELLNSIFRAAHTLKGGSGIVGFESVKEITHYTEDLLDMLRAQKIIFTPKMMEALYDAFDEVMNLIEAAEESGDIVQADAETVQKVIKALESEMGKTQENVESWEAPFMLVEDKESIINLPLKTLNGMTSVKIPFKNEILSDRYCNEDNLYAVVFDVEESCMVYGNDPIYTLSLLGDKVLGVFSCISNRNAEAILNGREDEEGLLLKSYIVAYIYATYSDIEDALFNFIDELHFLPLDIQSLLSINVGDSSYQLDSLKELYNIVEDSDIASVVEQVERAMQLIGKETLQYAKLQRFLDIQGLIAPEDLEKLNDFFNTLYKGDSESVSEESSEAFSLESQENTQVSEIIKVTLQNMLEQQYKALLEVTSAQGVDAIISILEKMRRFIPTMPSSFSSKDEVKEYLQNELDITPVVQESVVKQAQEPVIAVEEPKVVTKIEATVIKPKVSNVVSQKRDSVAEEPKKAIVGKTVKIDQVSIDALMNVAGELLVAKNSLPYLADNIATLSKDLIKREIMEKYIFINRLTEQLQDLIMGMRMLPISYVFDRYPKLVRDIAKKLGKKVKLETSGSNTKLDKNMIEMLADPLIHIMRNSLDHGIEMPDVREAQGKNSSGVVLLKAYPQSDRIIIEITDDGAGINLQSVAKKVLEKGLLTQEQIDALSDDEKAELVLLPGLSTAEEITELSGRGVGMDVVKKSIEGFGGSINIKTKAQEGTTITLAIPMSLAVTSLLHISMNSIHYGIPMDSVSETVKLEKSEIEYLNNEPFVYIRGEVIPLLFIESMLNQEIIKDEPLSIVVLNIQGNLLAVVVNKFLGQLDVVQKPLVGLMESHPLFSGTALLGNGQIIMAIDPLGLLGIVQELKEKR